MDSLPDDPRLTLDSVPAIYDDPGSALSDSEPVINNNPGNTPIFSAPATNEDHSSSTMDPTYNSRELVNSSSQRCVNCGSDCSQRTHRHRLTLADITTVIRRWIAPQIVRMDSIVCHSCWTMALNESNNTIQQPPSTSSGQRQRTLCIVCRVSLQRIRFHIYNPNQAADIWIIINQWIAPRQLSDSDKVCHSCYRRAQRAPRPQENVQPHNEAATIDLPELSRAVETQAHCFVPGCQSTERLIVPLWMRVNLFCDYKFYIPPSCRICRLHLQNNDWTMLEVEEPLRTFSVRHIQDFATFANERNKVTNWEDLSNVSEDYFFHWVGLSKGQFNELKNMIPSLCLKSYCNIALAAFLSKMRTGDSNERLCTIFNISKSTMSRYLNTARECLYNDFTPQHLGINHMTRDDIRSRNLTLPKGLFAQNNEPIVIVDGTYIYVQKSSNYLYQKNTYSLHKYRNLIKPVLIVCCDGYIVDALGPYPATTSDAEIMLHEFRDAQQPLRQYFHPGDVFILDRGFRDCISLLRTCGYSPHMPSSRQGRENQLSTLAANESRCVTICRWVVEAINGIMKKCFKLFRHEYFNASTVHLMKDFKIAAALINKFHKRISDRDDAEAILSVIQEKINMNNDLGDFVIENNLNRRRAEFENISINNLSFPRLTYSDLILITCGPYQLKQARSYYAEHIRRNGSYTIEICAERSNILNNFPPAENCTLLRGKLQSRHVSRKIYFVYILHTNNINNGVHSIKQYYCNCMVGRRTVGCCAHIATIIWFLSWARYETSIVPPAQHLDDVLIVYEDE